jgi:transposase
VRDELWEVVEPLIPPVQVPDKQGRRPVPDWVAFSAIVFVLVTGIAWRRVPRELGCSGVTAWRRLRDWQQAGVWKRLHAVLLDKLHSAGAIDWTTSVADGSHIRALQGGLAGARSPASSPARAAGAATRSR